MRYLKDVPRKFRNGFRGANAFKKAIGEKSAGKFNRAKIPRRRLK
jgi:hypothetical protein